MKISGKVVSGRGRANQDIAPHFNALETEYGKKIFPGTLNIVLKEPLLLNVNHAYDFESGRRFTWKVDIEGQAAFILLYRWNGCPLHVLEIISDVKLREVLELEDSSQVEFVIKSEMVSSLEWYRRIAWIIVWKWRSSWYYKRDGYKRLVYRLPRLRWMTSQTNSSSRLINDKH